MSIDELLSVLVMLAFLLVFLNAVRLKALGFWAERRRLELDWQARLALYECSLHRNLGFYYEAEWRPLDCMGVGNTLVCGSVQRHLPYYILDIQERDCGFVHA